MDHNKKKKMTPVLLSIVAVLFLLSLFFWFRGRLNTELNSATERYLTENVKALATVFYTKLDDQVVMLESQTRYFKDVDLTNYNQMKETIMSTKGIGAFKTIGVASAAGSTMNYNGMSSGNIMLTDYFNDAMAGDSAMSASTMLDEEKEDILAVAVPIIQEDSPVGIIYGTFTRDELNSLVDTVRFADSGANILVTDEGNILARTMDSPLIDDEAVNIYEMIPGVKLPKNEVMDYYVYDYAGQKNIIVLTTVGAHGWCFGTIVPESIVSSQSRSISRYVIIVIIATTVMFVILLFVALRLNASNNLMQRRTEKYRAVTNQSNDIIVDYDFENEIMTLEGNVLFVMNDLKAEYNKEEVYELLSRIHEEDKALYDELIGLVSSKQKTIHGEGRLKASDGEYYWFHVDMTVLCDRDGKSVRLVGNMINVDEQVNKEQSLIKKAETDLLTGIMNKIGFQEHTQSVMNGLGENEKIIFFIIDLDNFKAVNDNLGHIMGDKVLTEVSEKLNSIFCEDGKPGRIGGDEFAAYVMVKDSDKSVEDIIKQRGSTVCESVRADYTSEGKTIGISASVGVAVFPDNGADYKEIYGHADEALYISKEGGKNQYNVYKA